METSSATAAVDTDRIIIKHFENGNSSAVPPKIEIVGNQEDSLDSVTFAIWHEDHTLANSLRHLIMKDETVDFCGYSIPHPSEAKVHIRIQTKDSSPAIDALNRGLDNLISVTDHVLTSFQQSLLSKDYHIDEEAEF